jgi:hypothetical protein
MDNLRSSTKDDSGISTSEQGLLYVGPPAETHVHPFLIERLPEFPFEVDVQQARERQCVGQSCNKLP